MFRAVLALTLLFLASRAHAQDVVRLEGAIDQGDPRAIVELVVDTDAPGTFRAGVLFTLDPGWHVYWKNPGQSGLATEVTFGGAPFGPVQWPAPVRLVSRDGFIVTQGYEHETMLFAEGRGSAGTVVTAVVDYLVCEVDCIPGRAELRHTLGQHARPEPFERYAARVPRPPRELGVTLRFAPPPLHPLETIEVPLDVLGRGLSAPSAGPESAFFLDVVPQLEARATRIASNEHGVTVTLALHALADDPGADQRMRGVLLLARDGHDVAIEVDVPLRRARPSATPPVTPTASPPRSNRDGNVPPPFGVMFLFALLGGLVLNLMPCVLPILALKTASLATLGAKEGVAKHSAAYVLGVLGAMLALGAVIIALRHAGVGVGWGFQFQEPAFVVALSALLVLFALNLFGVFEISLGANALVAAVDARQGIGKSIGEGVLSVVLATPCSAPFLGTAIGFALAGSDVVLLLVLVAVGIGLAAPYVALAAFPPLRRRLPRPGPWMNDLKIVLGFALLATVVWLLWVLAQLGGAERVALALACLLCVALAAWIFGRTHGMRWARRAPLLGLALALVTVVAQATLAAPSVRSAPTAGGVFPYAVFEPSAVDREVRSGKPVFVYFTADWCVTCKVNERTVLSDAAVVRAMRDRGVVGFRGDWTARDEMIRTELARHGRAAVPLYLYYRPNEPDAPQVLPELLTVGTMLEAMR